MKLSRVAIIVVATALLAAPTVAGATPIRYTESAIASGSLGGTPFADKLVTIELLGDTVGVVPLGGTVFGNDGVGTVSVDGVGSATLTGTIRAVDNQGLSRAGISNFTVGAAILFTDNSAFGAYGLTTPIGPLSGAASFNPGFAFGSTSGNFILTSIVNSTSTFTATTTTAVPEPISVTLLGSGLLGLVARRLTRRSAA